MNVFVLCTGRCGSKTFAKACEHITNYTAGHETRCRVFGPERLAYPDRHIEVDNRLAWFLGRLNAAYGDDAFYVHLTRDPEEVAASYNSRWSISQSVVRAYRNGILMLPRHESDITICRDFVDTVNSNIEHFLQDKSRQLHIRMETAAEEFQGFWERIGAEGDLDAAVSEWRTPHNARKPPKRRSLGRRALRTIGLRPAHPGDD